MAIVLPGAGVTALIHAYGDSEFLPVPLGNGQPGVWLGFQPVQNQGFNDQLGVGKVPGAIEFKLTEQFLIEPVSPLFGL
jgi:hypothetical protein